jgi:hypothetical protein
MSSAQVRRFRRNTRKRARTRHGVPGMTDERIERIVDARLAEYDERARLRRVGRATRSAKWHSVIVARERATEKRARLRELRSKPCGARTRSGHPCRRKGLGKGGRCANHGGMSTGPRTPEGCARLSALLKARWAASRRSTRQGTISKVDKNRKACSRVAARSVTAKDGGR